MVFKHLKKIGHNIVILCWSIADDLLRFFLMTVLLRLAANLLSRERALKVAKWCGAVIFCFPSSGRPAFLAMKNAFSMQQEDAEKYAEEYLAQPFYSFVILHRLLNGRENIDNWKIEERNFEDVVQLRESGRSFILATGHFARHAAFAYFSRTSPGKFLVSVASMPAFSLAPAKLRVRLQYGQYLKAMQHCGKNIEVVVAGSPHGGRVLLDGLKRGGVNAIIHADAFWHDPAGGFVRPFAGHKSHIFAIGATTLSRLTQKPILMCIPYFKSDGTIVLEWGPTIPPPSRTDKEADIRNTNLIVDYLEKAIAQHPSQYVLYIGEERRWNSALQGWNDHPV